MRKQVHKLKEPNPLNLFKIRKLGKPPVHFEYITIPMQYNLEEAISKWIQLHMKHRYYIGKTLDLDSADKIAVLLKIGFEEPKELSYFTLACPHLKYK